MRISSVLSVLALSVASPLAVVSLLGLSAVAGQPNAFGVPPGVSDFGRSLATTAGPLAVAAAVPPPSHGLRLRRGCRWGQPGRAPYQGSTRQALLAAGLPDEVVVQIDALRQQGRKSGRLAMTRGGIRHTGDGRVFPARGFALSYGMTLCLDSSVNFAKGHVEMADLYEARDTQGRPYAVMVPDVCGNVSVLAMPGEQGRVAGMAATLARRAAALAAVADVLDPSATLQLAAGLAFQAAGAADRHLGQDLGQTVVAPGLVDDAPGRGTQGAAHALGTGGAVVRAPGQGQALPSSDPLNDPPGDQPGHRPRQQPAVLAAVGVVGQLLVPPQAAGAVLRALGRVTAQAGRGLQSLAGRPAGPSSAAAAGPADTPQAVPEPGSLWTVLLALAVLCALRLSWVRRR